MLEEIESILSENCGLVKDRSIIVGVSGGPDSFCLMDLLRQAEYPVIVAHFDHQLRPESGEESRLVEKIAAQLKLESRIEGADVRAYAEKEKISIEEAARILRYRFLFKLAREYHAQAVAVGHTADDQVETILMHFLRGSALSGLKGMSYRSIINVFDPEIPIVRPLLRMFRQDTVDYCEENGLHPHYDSSNDSLDFQRNRIRHILIPALETYNPKLREVVLRMSQALQDDHSILMETVDQAWHDTFIKSDEQFIAFNAELLSNHSRGLQRNLVKRAMETLQPGMDITFSILERAANTIGSDIDSSQADLKAGLYIFREANVIYISTADAKLPINFWPQMNRMETVPISIPAQIDLAGGWKFHGEHREISPSVREEADRNEDQFQVWLDAGNLSDGLNLRVYRPGDRFMPLGLDGHSQKLSDFFVNEKVPQRARALWPLLCKGDEIIWVPGYRPAHPYRLTSQTSKVIYFSITRPLEKLSE